MGLEAYLDREDVPADVKEAIKRDITERKWMEEKLRESEERYGELYESSKDGITSATIDGRIVDCNQAYANMHGYTKEELKKINFQKIISSKSYDLIQNIIKEKLIPRGYSGEYEVDAIKKDGTIIPISGRAWLIKDKDGNPSGMWAIAHNISDRKRAEESLQDSKDRFRYIFEQSKDSIYITTREGKIVDVNHAMLDLLGRTREELIEFNVKEGYANPNDRLRFQQEIEQKGSVRDFEAKLRKKDGTEIDCLITATLRRNNDGSILGYQGIIRDITERKKLEQQLKEYTENLEELVDEQTKALRNSESKLQAILTGIGDLISIQNRDLDVIWVNKQVKDTYGDVVGKKCYKAYRKLAEKCHNCPVEKAFDEEKTVVSEGSSIRLDGQRIHTLLTSSPVRDTEGNIVAVVEIVKDITDRKNLEQQLIEYNEKLEKIVEERTAEFKESEERYRGLYESSLDGIISFDAEEKLIECNQAFADMIGYSKEELYQLKSWDFVDPDWHDTVRTVAKHLSLGDNLAEYELVSIKKDGTPVPVSLRSWLIRDKDGNPLGTWCVVRDISERKKIEEEIKNYTQNLEKFVEERTLELKKSESRLQQLLTTSPAVIYSCEPVGDYGATFVSENVKSLLGYEPWEFVDDSKFWADHIHPEDTERIFMELSRLVDLNYHIHEYRFQHKNGTYRWMRDEMRLLRDAKGNPQEIVGAWFDITNRKQMEAKLHASEERFRGLYESSIDGIFFLDMKRNIIDCNQSLADMLGYTQQELCEMTFWQITPSKWYDMINKFISKQVIKRGFSDAYEQEVIKNDGMIIPVSVRVRIIKDKDGKTIGSWGLVRDITESKKLEAQLKEYTENLERRVKERTMELNESEQRYRQLVELSPDAIVLTSLEGQVTMCNVQAADLFGFESVEDVFGQNMFDFVAAEEHQDAIDRLRKRIQGIQDVEDIEYTLLKKDGTRFNAELRISSIQNSAGKPQAFINVIRDITERTQMEAKLRESEERYRNLYESSVDGIVSVDLERNIVECNQAYADMLGYNKEEVYQLNLLDITPEEWQDKNTRIITEQLIPQGYTNEFESEDIKKDGTIFPVSIRSWLIKDMEGNPAGMWAIVRDITERKTLENQLKQYTKKLEESEARYRGLYESSIDGIASATMDGTIADCNQAFADMLGYTKEEVYQITYREYVPNKWHDLLDKIFTEQILPRGYSDEFEAEAIKKDGTIFPVSARIWIIKDKEGNPIGRWGIVRDITERKRAEEALKESEERYRGLYESSMDGIVSVTVDGNIVECNQALENMLGYTKENLCNLNYRDLIPRKWHDMLDKINTEQTILQGYSDVIEAEVINKDGTIIPVSIRGWLIKDKDDNPIGMWGTVRDITERKQLEASLKEYTENLENLVDERTLQLKESGTRYRGLYESSIDGIVSVDMEGNILECNQAFANNLGYTKEELYKLNYEELTPSKWHDMEAKILAEQMFTRGYTEVYEKEYIKKDGRILPVSIRGWLIKEKDGTPTGMWAIVRDVTEQKKMERQLKQYTKNLEESEARYRNLYEASIDGVVFIDMNDNIIECNQAFSHMLGYTKDELHTLNYRELIPSKWSDIYEKIFAEKVLLKNKADMYEIEFIRKDGMIISASVRGWVIKDKNDTPIYGWAIIRDITDRKQAEENLKQCRDELKQILEER